MYKIDKYQVKVYINLDDGLYIFPDESATGKTRLGTLLESYGYFGNRTIYLTYKTGGKEYRDEILGLKQGYYRVIMLDRCDMCYDVFNDTAVINKLKELSKESVILADCKGQCKLFDVADTCFIDMAKEEISVSQ